MEGRQVGTDIYSSTRTVTASLLGCGADNRGNAAGCPAAGLRLFGVHPWLSSVLVTALPQAGGCGWAESQDAAPFSTERWVEWPALSPQPRLARPQQALHHARCVRRQGWCRLFQVLGCPGQGHQFPTLCPWVRSLWPPALRWDTPGHAGKQVGSVRGLTLCQLLTPGPTRLP